MFRTLSLCLLSATLLGLLGASAAEPFASGLAPGERPGPYSSVASVGPQRGKSHCFICETADRPAVIVFARRLDDGLGNLVRQLDKALEEHKKAELRAWVTFLNADQTAFDPQVVEWARKESVRNIPLSVFEDVEGPPSYKLHRDADVTVMLAVKQKVVRNFAFKSGELSEKRIGEIVKAVDALAGSEKK
jgi:hypothetical protein